MTFVSNLQKYVDDIKVLYDALITFNESSIPSEKAYKDICTELTTELASLAVDALSMVILIKHEKLDPDEVQEFFDIIFINTIQYTERLLSHVQKVNAANVTETLIQKAKRKE